VLAAGWLAVGGVALYHYVDRYWLYRGFPAPVTPAGIPTGTIRDVSFYSPALHQRRDYLVYLPPGYARGAAEGRRYPVLYLLHAPPGRIDGFFKAGEIDVRENVMLAHHQVRPMVFVVPDGKTPAYSNDTEWANAGAGRYESFVMDVVRNVDRRFAVAADRAHRGIAGLSEGGYGALNVGLHHLAAFSVIESWSGYYQQTPTGPFAHSSRAQLATNSPADYVASLAPRIRRLGLRAWLYQGDKDQIEPWRIRRFAAQLHGAGALVRYGYFPGGHDWGLWRREMPRMLRAASAWFGRSPRARSATARGRLVAIGAPASKAVRDRVINALRARCHMRHLPRGERRPKLCGPARRRRSRVG
jgi:enterochelin esterase-like enzyme